MSDTELPPSDLGTFEHWDETYKAELSQFKDIGDPGTEWFGRGATKRMTNWIKNNSAIERTAAILDIGCGNGLLLLELAKIGYTHLVGVDYCESALNLAKEVFADEELPSNSAKWLTLDITRETLIKSTVDENVISSSAGLLDTYKIWDKTKPISSTHVQSKFIVCLDKGTYDAISLCPDNPHAQRTKYIDEISRLLDDQGWFLITSCNWTAIELKSHFSNFRLVEELPAPSFTFGGKSGKTVSACVFRK